MAKNTIVIQMEEDSDMQHTDAHPFCKDNKCGCHEDLVLIGEVNQLHQDGLLTENEATLMVAGRTV